MTSRADYTRAFTRACLERAPRPTVFAGLGRDAARFERYRAMVRGRLADLLGEALPRTRSALGDRSFAKAFDAYMAGGGPRSRYVREVSLEFVRHLVGDGRGALAGCARYTSDLARYESVRMECLIADDRYDGTVTDFAMHLPPAMAPWARYFTAEHAVHQDPVVSGRVALLVYRESPSGGVAALVLNPVAADLVEGFITGGAALETVVATVLSRRGEGADAAFAEGLAELLGDLMDRGVLLGSREV